MASRKEFKALLEGYFGKVFNYKASRPLKPNILEEIISRGNALNLPFSDEIYEKALEDYTGRIKYLELVAQGGKHFDIQGKHSGFITIDEQNKAKLRIDDIKNGHIKRQNEKIEEELDKKTLKILNFL